MNDTTKRDDTTAGDEVPANAVTTAALAERAGISYPQAVEFLRAALDVLRQGREIHLTNFGIFRLSDVRGRTLRTPILPGGVGTYPKRKVVRFRGAKQAADYVNGDLAVWNLRAYRGKAANGGDR